MNHTIEHFEALGVPYPPAVAEVDALRDAVTAACDARTALDALVANLANPAAPVSIQDVHAAGVAHATSDALRFHPPSSGVVFHGRPRDDVIAALDARERAAWLAVRDDVETELRVHVERAGKLLAKAYDVLGATPDPTTLHLHG